MQIWKLILASPIFLSACDETIQTKIAIPYVPADLRTPVQISDRKAKTLRDLTLLATEHLNSAQAANSKIIATDKILTAAEDRAKKDN